MDYLVPKAPGDTVTYFIDWSKQLVAGDQIASFTLTVSSGTVTIPQTPDNFGTFLRFLVGGGANDEVATLACTVHTIGLQVLTRDIQLLVSDGAIPLTPSTASKRQILTFTFQTMGLPGYEFDATPEEWAAALFAMDTQMATWRTNDLNLNYNAPASLGSSDLDDESGIGDDAVLPVGASLAFCVAPAIGKTLSTEAKITASTAMNALRARYLPKVERIIPPGTPVGAGAKPWSTWWPYGFTGQGSGAGV